jgi:Uma2 family endonuclease
MHRLAVERVTELRPGVSILGHVAELRFSPAEPIIMGMPDLLTPSYWTAEMVRALPDDGQRYEVVHGELLVTPAPRAWHQVVLGRLFLALSRYLEEQSVGHLFFSPADISWDRDTLVQPDLFVADLAEARTLDWASIRSLLFVAEVLSPSTARQDRFAKRRRYQEAGVGTYWIVDPDHHAVEIWTPSDLFPQVERDRLIWHPSGARKAFTLSLQEFLLPL